jgi:hypothetical protein
VSMQDWLREPSRRSRRSDRGLSRPGDKYLAGPFETTAASEELGKRRRRKPG